MSINFSAKQDYSFLFNSLGSSGSAGPANLNFLSDYMSIKNGSYGKVMKAYYQKTGDEKESSPIKPPEVSTSTASDTAKTLASIDKAADALKNSADALINKGKDSLFKEKEVTTKQEDGTTVTEKKYDMDSIYKAVSSFVKDYNSLLTATGKSDSANIAKSVKNMTNLTAIYSKSLEKAGITVGKDNKLTLDEKTFKAADMDTLKSTFNASPSFTYSISSQASYIDFTASREAAKANTYNAFGSYDSNYTMGNIFNNYF